MTISAILRIRQSFIQKENDFNLNKILKFYHNTQISRYNKNKIKI